MPAKTRFTLREIADRLGLSYRTVMRYAQRPGKHQLCRRMVRNRVRWTRAAIGLFQKMYDERKGPGRKKKPRKPGEVYRW